MRRANVFWGLILILLGVLFLLQALHLIDDVFGWFWPSALILLGLWVLFSNVLPHTRSSAEPFELSLEGATQLDLNLDLGLGSVSFSGGTLEGTALSGTRGKTLEIRHNRSGERLLVDLNAGPNFLPFLGPDEGDWQFALTCAVPLNLKVKAGASSLDFDLTDVNLKSLRLEAGASTINIKLPASVEHSEVFLETGAATLDLQLPDGVAASILMEQGASTLDVDRVRFPLLNATGNHYQSPDYAENPHRVDINLKGGANSVRVG